MKQLLLPLAAPIGLLTAFVIFAGSVLAPATAAGEPTVGQCAATGVRADGLTTDQQANAETITAVALSLGLGAPGVTIGLTVALTESGLVNVGYGDTMNNGQMSSSRGLFQQLSAWGPLDDRLDPTKAATMFFTGGQAGQAGLMDIADWQTMPIPQAAQAVQQSEFADGSNFAKQVARATAITAAVISCAAAPTTGSGGSVTVVGVSVTVPDNPNVTAALRGTTITAPTAAVARGIAAGFAQLGGVYVWGGGTNGGPADEGCNRGGGENNSCQGIVGFDCSGLTAFVLKQAGFSIPTNSSGQRSAGVSVPWSQGQPGDIIGFPGHVALFLGVIGGTPYILQASTYGVPIHVKALTRTGFDTVLHRYWGPASIG